MYKKKTKKLINKSKGLISFLFHKKTLSAYPNTIGIEPTNRCNMKCQMCVRDSLTRPTADMDFDKFCHLVDQVKNHVSSMTFIGIGEPLLHPRIADMVKYASSGQLTTYLVTNGLMLTEKISKDLIDSGLDELCVSIDGLKESYAAIRGEGFYEKVVTNVNNFLKIRNNARPLVNINMIAEKHNQHETVSFNDFWKDKVDCVTIKRIHNFGGHVQLHKGPDKSNNTQYRRINTCHAPWFSMLVLADGCAIPCCGDINGTLSYGNVFDQPFKKVWNSQKAITIRTLHLNKDFDNDTVCSVCNMKDISSFRGNWFGKAYRYFFKANRNLQGFSDFDI